MPADGDRMTLSGLTDQQHRAVAARGVSVALSAGAGCGKTFVLTERFLSELEPDAAGGRPRLGQIVAITFTERAAREMRNRIRDACNRRLMECPENQANDWLELVRELDSARISTIHSFCGALLRGHAVEAGVDPRFRVLDGAQSSTLLFELTDDVLRNRFADRDEAILSLVTRFSLDRLRTMTARLLAARQEIDWSVWRSETPEGLVARWEEFWRHDTLPRLLRGISQSSAAQTMLNLASRYPPDHLVMRQRCDLLQEHIPKLPASQQPDTDLKAIREAARVQGGGGKKAWVNEDVYEQFKNAAEKLRKDIDRAGARASFDAIAARPTAETALQLVDLAADVAEHYDRKKQELSVLDFNDLLILARNLLARPEHGELRKRLAAQTRLLLVDEFQDTDPLQVELVKTLCNNEHLHGKLFFVGDHKQSIYRFRGADPHVFRQLREEIPDAGRLPLSLNFRSQPAVLDFVNLLFHEEMGPDYEPLRPCRPQVGPTPAVEFLWANSDPDDDGSFASPPDDMGPRERLRRREADWIARRLRAILDSGETIVWDAEAAKAGPPAVRAVQPGDIALLFRALTNVEYYEEALQRYGIDYYLVGGHAFYAQQEIHDLLNLLRTLNSPCDEVSLTGVLRSPFFSLFDETLFWLSRHPDGLAAGLFGTELPKELDADQRRRTAFAATTLRELRAVKDRLPVARLIQEGLRRTGYDALLLAEFLGERKLANLHKLIEQARSFDRTGIFALTDFITQLSEFVARQPDEPLAATHPESTDVVKLMSIHQSKGLEFPVVVIPDVDRPRRRMSPPVAFTPQLGPMFKEPDVTTGYDLYMAAEDDEELAELSRLLYVAATRAADYLILAAGVEQPGEAAGPWTKMLARRFDLLSGEGKDEGREGRKEERGERGEGSGGLAVRGQSDGANDFSAPSAGVVRVTVDKPPIHTKSVDPRRRRDLLKIVEKARQMADDGAGRWPRYLAPVPIDDAARRQYSFSRLTGKLHAETPGLDVGPLDADPLSEPSLDARGLGTLVHAVLAEIDFSRPGDVTAMVERLAPRHLPKAEQRLDEPVEMVQRFLASPRAGQLGAAQEVHAELEFLLAWPPGGEQSEGRYLQGFIDCLYRDDTGQWRLIDYKTNRATEDTLASVAAPYEMQMLVYALAAETILKSPPVELVLCFLRPGLEYHFNWDATARRRVVELIDEALP